MSLRFFYFNLSKNIKVAVKLDDIIGLEERDVLIPETKGQKTMRSIKVFFGVFRYPNDEGVLQNSIEIPNCTIDNFFSLTEPTQNAKQEKSTQNAKQEENEMELNEITRRK